MRIKAQTCFFNSLTMMLAKYVISVTASLLFCLTAAYAQNVSLSISAAAANRTINGEIPYSTLVAEIQQWHLKNPDACGHDTAAGDIRDLVDNFEPCTPAHQQPRQNRTSTKIRSRQTFIPAVPRIFNGCPLERPSTVGWAVSVVFRNVASGRSSLCSGTLISAQHIALAAHCFRTIGNETRPAYKTIGVIIGSTNLFVIDTTNRTQYFRAEAFARHPNFTADGYGYDTAVIKLSQSVSFGQPNGVRPACLPSAPTLSAPDSMKCVVAGYGINNFTGNGTGEGLPRYTVVSVVEMKQCLDLAKRSDKDKPSLNLAGLFPSLFCALGMRKKANSDTCRGDSGAGLTCRDPASERWTLQGIVKCAETATFFGDAFVLGIRSASNKRHVTLLASTDKTQKQSAPVADIANASGEYPADAYDDFVSETDGDSSDDISATTDDDSSAEGDTEEGKTNDDDEEEVANMAAYGQDLYEMGQDI